MLKLFVTDKKGYVDEYRNVSRVKITKVDNKNVLQIEYNSSKENEYIALSDITLCYLIDVNTMHEYFRYEK
jgi:hypothetical protein